MRERRIWWRRKGTGGRGSVKGQKKENEIGKRRGRKGKTTGKKLNGGNDW